MNRLFLLFAATVLVALAAPGSVSAASGKPANDYFAIRVVDRQTGRGVPLVELRTTNSIRLVTDSNGLVAFLEPGLMDREVFFFIESHGYEFPQDGFGSRGIRLRTTPGQEAIVKIDRLNVAERLYRLTGQGIYRDSVLLGRPVPLKNPVLNGQVMGQDSVFTCLYRGRVFWLWGDTGKPSYPLGNFAMSGALSDLPARGGLDPAVGVNLEYFVGGDGFSRKMAPLPEPGMVWLDGLLTVADPHGRERMVAKFARLKSLTEVLERGLMVFNDATNTFEPLVRPGLELLPYRNMGHAFPVQVQGRPYYYFTAPSPMAARLRVPAQWEAVIDANQYEVLTALASQGKAQRARDIEGEKVRRSEEEMTLRPSPVLTFSPSSSGRPETPWRWVKFGDVLASLGTGKTAAIEALEAEAKDVRVYDIVSGREIIPHNGTVYFNAHRRRWIGIFGQLYGESSALGEIWYAEADTPVGPWAYARKILTHHKYSFYNPKHHPLFDQDDGRTVYFEGTYTWTFSGSEDRATPRYDYNQIMYRLNLDEPRLILPVPVYQYGHGVHRGPQREPMRWGPRSTPYGMGDAVTRGDGWDSVDAVAFYAVEPNRPADGLVAVYVGWAMHTAPGSDDGSRAHGTPRLTIQPEPSAQPLFLALPPGDAPSENPHLVPLYEYRHAASGRYLYATQPHRHQEGWDRAERPLCRVWKTPSSPLLLDARAQPVNRGPERKDE